MNIVFVNVWLDPERGAGTAERTRRLARHLSDLGCVCSIVTMGGSRWHGELTTAGIRVYSCAHLGRRFPIPLVHPLDLWRTIRHSDVVHIMGYWYLLAAFVYLFARLVRKPVIVCPAGELSAFDRRRLHKRLYHRLIGQRMMTGAASIVATTVAERDYIMTDFGPVLPSIIVSPNGIALPTAPERNDLRLPEAPFVLFLGRLTAIKGPDLLVEAFAQICNNFPDLHLVVAGPDLGMGRRLEDRVCELGIARRVHFLGFVDEGQRRYLYRKARLLAVPSRSEVMSMVALEAGAMGVPVLLTDRCGFQEVAECSGGLVVAPDQTALASGLASMLSDPTALGAMGERLRSFVLQQYAWPAVACDLLIHFRSLKD
jgi:glycosyltransferase involved in cell wall biosynthesis